MAGLDISPTQVGFIIIKAREYDAKVAAGDDSRTAATGDDEREGHGHVW